MTKDSSVSETTKSHLTLLTQRSTDKLYMGGLGIVLAIFLLSELTFLNLPSHFRIVTLFVLTATVTVLILLLLIKGARLSRGVKVTVRKASVCLAALILGITFSHIGALRVSQPAKEFLSRYGSERLEMLVIGDRVIHAGESFGIYDVTLIGARSTADNKYLSVPRIKMRLTVSGQDILKSGAIAKITATPKIPEEVTSDDFRQREYLYSQEIMVACNVTEPYTVYGMERLSLLDKIRETVSRKLWTYIAKAPSDDNTAIALCMLLGDKTAVKGKIRDFFAASGASHILSISGMHLSILFLFLGSTLHLSIRPHRRFPISEAVLCIIALSYMLLAGLSPSIMRASLMLICGKCFDIFAYYHRKLCKSEKYLENELLYNGTHKAFHMDSLCALLCSAAIVGAVSPYSLADIGFRLSFMSTLGIILSMPLVRAIAPTPKRSPAVSLFLGVIITLFAVSMTLPFTVYSFGTIPVLSPVTNLLLTPIIAPLLILLLLLSVLSLFSFIPAVGLICTLLGKACAILCEMCTDITRCLSSLEYSVLTARHIFTVALIFAVITLCAFFLYTLSRTHLSALVGSMAVVMYIILCGYFFISEVSLHNTPSFSLCTVSDRPYACVSIGRARVSFDTADSLAAIKHTRDTMGDSLYRTDNYYVIVPSKDFSSEYAKSNIELCTVSPVTILLPSPERAMSGGCDMTEYRELVKELSRVDAVTEFYGDSFSVYGLSFKVIGDNNATAFIFDDNAVIFDSEYSEEFASNVSESSNYCIYFCKSVKKTENSLYTSSAELYLPSAHYKKVKGASKIPTGTARMLDK